MLKGELDTECNPMFYVNVNDIDTLHTTRHYVACEGRTAVLPLFLSLPPSLTNSLTPSFAHSLLHSLTHSFPPSLVPSFTPLSTGTSERILQSKTDLYDVFVDQQRLVTHLASLDSILRLTPADRERYELLNNIR